MELGSGFRLEIEFKRGLIVLFTKSIDKRYSFGQGLLIYCESEDNNRGWNENIMKFTYISIRKSLFRNQNSSNRLFED